MRTGISFTARETVEKLFEKHRPKGKPSRVKSFFLAKTPDDVERLGASSAKYLYLVVPVGGVRTLHRGDFEWLWRAGSIQMGLDTGMSVLVRGGLVTYLPWAADAEAKRKNQILVKELVLSYWRGKRSDNFKGWEYLAPKIRIVQRVKT